VRGINVGEEAAARESCARIRDELWFKGREWFRHAFGFTEWSMSAMS